MFLSVFYLLHQFGVWDDFLLGFWKKAGDSLMLMDGWDSDMIPDLGHDE